MVSGEEQVAAGTSYKQQTEVGARFKVQLHAGDETSDVDREALRPQLPRCNSGRCCPLPAGRATGKTKLGRVTPSQASQGLCITLSIKSTAPPMTRRPYSPCPSPSHTEPPPQGHLLFLLPGMGFHSLQSISCLLRWCLLSPPPQPSLCPPCFLWTLQH